MSWGEIRDDLKRKRTENLLPKINRDDKKLLYQGKLSMPRKTVSFHSSAFSQIESFSTFSIFKHCIRLRKIIGSSKKDMLGNLYKYV